MLLSLVFFYFSFPLSPKKLPNHQIWEACLVFQFKLQKWDLDVSSKYIIVEQNVKSHLNL